MNFDISVNIESVYRQQAANANNQLALEYDKGIFTTLSSQYLIIYPIYQFYFIFA